MRLKNSVEKLARQTRLWNTQDGKRVGCSTGWLRVFVQGTRIRRDNDDTTMAKDKLGSGELKNF